MNQDILLSKIVPNPTDTTWAQAYTTLNVYITLSIQNEKSKVPVTSLGKDLLEKLQREFFALDNKSLENIKKAVGNVSKSIEAEFEYSILVGAIVEDVLYIVIASTGQIIIRRNGKAGVIATGVKNELHGFSGKLRHNDIIVFETGDFAKKFPLTDLSEYLTSTDVSQIAENITPLIHEGSKGTESAIIIQYKDMKEAHATEDYGFAREDEEEDQPQKDEGDKDDGYYKENLWTKSRRENNNIEELAGDNNQEEETSDKKRFFRPTVSLPSFNFVHKKIIILGVVIILIAVLVGSIVYQGYKKTQTENLAKFSAVFQPVKDKFDEGVKLSALNKTLALDDLSSASQMLKSVKEQFPKDSVAAKQISDLDSQIKSKISELGGGSSAKNIKEFLKPGGDLKSITAITNKGGMLLILDHDGKQVVTVSTDGKIKKTYDIKNSDNYISSDDKFIYTLGDTITSIDRGNGKVTQIVKNVKDGTGFDMFGSNVYVLTNNDVLKYKAPSYDSSSYFTDKPSFKGTPIDMSISGPVWILEQGGNVERFTKGKNDNLSLSGLTGPIADGGKIYADSDNNNVYVMDVKNQRVVVLNSKGEYQNQIEGSFIKDATSFAIDEKNKTGYILSGNTIFTFDL